MNTVKKSVVAISVLCLLGGCSWWAEDETPIDPRTASMREMLSHSPKSATLTIAAPELSMIDGYIDRFNLREYQAVREGIDSVAAMAGLDEGVTVDDIAAAIHLDPNAPLLLHLRANDNDSYDVVLVASPTDADAAQAKAGDIIDAQIESSESADDNPSTHLFESGAIALSSSTAFLEDCIDETTPPVYGSEDCPPSSNDAIAFLANKDAAALFARANALPMVQDYLNGATGAHVITELWDDNAGVHITARVQHESETTSAPLTLAPMLPPASESFIGWRMSPEGKDALREQWLATLPASLENDPMYAMAATQLESFLHATGDEFAVAALGLESARPQFAAMFALRDSTQAAGLLGAFSPLFKEVSREGDTSVYGLPPAMGVPLAYAIHKNTLIVGPDADLVAGAIGQLNMGEPTGLYPSLDPPLEAEEPSTLRALLSQRLLADLVVPMVSGAGLDERAANLIEFVSRAQAIQIHRQLRNNWDTWSVLAIP